MRLASGRKHVVAEVGLFVAEAGADVMVGGDAGRSGASLGYDLDRREASICEG